MKKALLGAALASVMHPALATISPVTPTTSPITVGGVHVDDIIYFSPSPADAIFWSDCASCDFPGQDSGAIELVIEGLIPGADLTAAGQWDSLSGDGTTYDANAFNVIAVHYDNKELVFAYVNPIDNFTVNDLGQEISNVRSYTATGGIFQQCEGDCGPTPAYAPGTIGLLSLGLLGLFLERRRIK